MERLIEIIGALRGELDALRPLSGDALRQLQKHYDVELTYTSNAIEGNTLTLRETAEVIEHGITVGGKRLKDHLEAVDHHDAVLWMREVARRTSPITEEVVRDLHARVVARSEPGIAGRYSTLPRRIAGSPVVFPNPVKLPVLIEAFGSWLSAAEPTPETAFEAHFRLTAIHPFADGNGRTARLLMNLLLIRGGFVPVAVRPADRKVYLDSLEHASLTDDFAPFQTLMHRRLAETLQDYVRVVREAIAPSARPDGAGIPPP